MNLEGIQQHAFSSDWQLQSAAVVRRDIQTGLDPLTCSESALCRLREHPPVGTQLSLRL